MDMYTDAIKKLTRLGLALAAGGALYSQNVTGGFSGRITDPKGKPVENARVRVNSPALSLPREMRTNARGEWRLGLLPPGDYKLTVSAEGYYASGTALYLGVGKTEAVQFVLKPQQVSGVTVEVIDAATVLEAKTEVKTSTNFQGEQLLALPTMKTYTDIMAYAPGVNSSGWVRGADPKAGMTYKVDGVDVRDDVASRNSIFSVSMVNPILDSIQDVQLIQNNVNARNGNSLGSQYTAVTKRGGNEFSGSLRATYARGYWASQNSGTSASASSSGDKMTQAQWSWTLSGPIIRDRVSFFLAGIRTPDIDQLAPTAAMNTVNYPGQMVPMKTRLTGTDAVLRNGPGGGYAVSPDTVGQFLPSANQDQQWDGRITASLTADQTLDLKFSYRKRALTNSFTAITNYDQGTEDERLIGDYTTTNDSQSLTYLGTLTPNLLIEASFSQAKVVVGADNKAVNGAQIPVLSALEANTPLSSTYQYYPNAAYLDPLGYASSSFINGGAYNYLIQQCSPVSPVKEKHRTRTINANLKYYLDLGGQHEIDLGGEDYLMGYNAGAQFGPQNKVVFAGGSYTNGTDIKYPTVNFEGIGVNNQLSVLGPAPVLMEAWAGATEQKTKSLAFWLNDQWVVNDRLNVNLGLRWSRYQVVNQGGKSLATTVALDPRVMVRWDPKGNGKHLFSLSFTRNTQGYSSVVSYALAVNPANAYTLRGWAGINGQPSLSGLGSGTDNGNYGVRYVSYADLVDPANYATTPFNFVNRSVQTRLEGLRAPYADTWEFYYTRNLSDATSVRIGVVDKRYRQELMSWTDYTWDYLALATDPSGSGGGRPQWLQVTKYGSTHKPRIYRDLELSIKHKLTSRLSWDLGWTYFYEYKYDEAARLNYASVKKNPTYNPLPGDVYLGDGLTQKNHRVTSLLAYMQPLGKGSITYTLAANYLALNPSSLTGYYTLYGLSASTLLNPVDSAHNPQNYPVTSASGYSTLPVYWGKPGQWKTGLDSYSFDFSISWNVPLGLGRAMLIGTAGVTDLFHHVITATYGYSAPTMTGANAPNGRLIGNFTYNGVAGAGWGNNPLNGGTTRPVTNVTVGVRF